MTYIPVEFKEFHFRLTRRRHVTRTAQHYDDFARRFTERWRKRHQATLTRPTTVLITEYFADDFIRNLLRLVVTFHALPGQEPLFGPRMPVEAAAIDTATNYPLAVRVP